VQELAAKPESELDTEEVTDTLDTYAHWLPCSKQVLDDVTGLRALLDTTLVNGLLDKTDAALFADMTTGGRYTAFSPTGSIVADNVARIVTALQVLGATSVKVAMNPTTYLAMVLTKASTAGSYLGMPPGVQATFVSSASVTAGKLLAWSDTGAVWANREGVSVVAGLNADDFTKNKVTLLAEHRGALLTLDAQHAHCGGRCQPAGGQHHACRRAGAYGRVPRMQPAI
jgi:HK97 family phage major capsid protein